MINLYRPAQGNVKSSENSLETALQIVDLTKRDVIIIGDFSIYFLTKSDREY